MVELTIPSIQYRRNGECPRMREVSVEFEVIHPLSQLLRGRMLEQAFATAGDGSQSEFSFIGGEEEFDRPGQVAAGLERDGRVTLQGAEGTLSFVLYEALLQEVPQEVVIAVRTLTTRLESEHVVACQVVKMPRCAVLSQQALRQLVVDVIEAAGAEKEALDGG